MGIYTKTGDKGTTSLADGSRVSKASARVMAYGDIDELISHLGVLRSKLSDDIPLRRIQVNLMNVSAHLATEKLCPKLKALDDAEDLPSACRPIRSRGVPRSPHGMPSLRKERCRHRRTEGCRPPGPDIPQQAFRLPFRTGQTPLYFSRLRRRQMAAITFFIFFIVYYRISYIFAALL